MNAKKNILTHLENLEKLLDTKISLLKYNIESINNDYFIEAKKILPNNNYIGFSITQGNVYRKKNWPISKFINVAKKITKMNKVPVFLIKKSDSELISRIKNRNRCIKKEVLLLGCFSTSTNLVIIKKSKGIKSAIERKKK